MSRPMLLAIGGLLLACLAMFALRGVSDGAPNDATGVDLSTPENSDYYMDEARIWQMDDQGDLSYRMTIARMLHFPDDSARFLDIDVHYLSGTDTYWDLTAARGRLPPGERDIYLHGGVEARHPREAGSVMTITADHAWVRPDDDLIETDAHVRAEEPGRRVDSDGMTVDLAADKLRLLDNVQVIYTP